jgi:hypothetical protein
MRGAKLGNNLLTGALVFLAFVFCVSGSTYYVSESGSDSNSAANARSPSTPWKTLAAVQSAIDSSVFAGGDVIAFARGSTFNGILNFGIKLRNLTVRFRPTFLFGRAPAVANRFL